MDAKKRMSESTEFSNPDKRKRIQTSLKKDESFETEMRLLLYKSESNCLVGQTLNQLRMKYDLEIRVYSDCESMSTDRICHLRGKFENVSDCIKEIIITIEKAKNKSETTDVNKNVLNEANTSQNEVLDIPMHSINNMITSNINLISKPTDTNENTASIPHIPVNKLPTCVMLPVHKPIENKNTNNRTSILCSFEKNSSKATNGPKTSSLTPKAELCTLTIKLKKTNHVECSIFALRQKKIQTESGALMSLINMKTENELLCAVGLPIEIRTAVNLLKDNNIIDKQCSIKSIMKLETVMMNSNPDLISLNVQYLAINDNPKKFEVEHLKPLVQSITTFLNKVENDQPVDFLMNSIVRMIDYHPLIVKYIAESDFASETLQNLLATNNGLSNGSVELIKRIAEENSTYRDILVNTGLIDTLVSKASKTYDRTVKNEFEAILCSLFKHPAQNDIVEKILPLVKVILLKTDKTEDLSKTIEIIAGMQFSVFIDANFVETFLELIKIRQESYVLLTVFPCLQNIYTECKDKNLQEKIFVATITALNVLLGRDYANGRKQAESIINSFMFNESTDDIFKNLDSKIKVTLSEILKYSHLHPDTRKAILDSLLLNACTLDEKKAVEIADLDFLANILKSSYWLDTIGKITVLEILKKYCEKLDHSKIKNNLEKIDSSSYFRTLRATKDIRIVELLKQIDDIHTRKSDEVTLFIKEEKL